MFNKRNIYTVKFKAIVSGHIYLDEIGHEDVEILTQIDSDEMAIDIFCDIEEALLEQIDRGKSEDYYFIAIINSNFIKEESYWEGVEYDVEHEVVEIKQIENIYK